MKESQFQHMLINKIKDDTHGASFVLKNDPIYCQGIPDLLVICGSHWAMLECKVSKDAPYRPNQKWYLDFFNSIGFARVIYPGVVDEVLAAMYEYLSRRNNE